MQIRLTQRQINLGVFGFNAALSWLIFFVLLGNGDLVLDVVNGLLALAISGLGLAYWYGRSYARHILVVVMTLALTLTLPAASFSTSISLLPLVPPILALTLTEPVWVLGVGLAVYAIIGVRTGGHSVYFEPANLVLGVIVLGGMVLSRLAIDNSQQLDAAKRTAEQARHQAEVQALELERKTAELEQRSQQQQRLLDLVATLETPTIALADGVLLAPLVGNLDPQRARTLTDRLLGAVSSQRAQLVVLDIAGVTLIDTEVAEGLLRTIQAVRLLGCDVTITGIAPNVAMTLTQLGIQLSGVSTAASPQEALTKRYTRARQ